MENSNGTTVIRIKRKREAEPINSLVIAATIRDNLDVPIDKESLGTHVFRRFDTVTAVKSHSNQTARIKRGIQRSFKTQHLTESLEERKNRRLAQKKTKKDDDLEKRRNWQAVMEGCENVSISEKSNVSKPVFGRRLKKKKRDTAAPTEFDIDFVDIDVTSMLHHRSVNSPPSNSDTMGPSKVDLSQKSPTKVLNPMERRLDEAIFVAFNAGDTAPLTDHLLSQNQDINFTRAVDGTTPLMAAAWCGNEELCRQLVARGVDTSLLDIHGASAQSLADRRGHIVVAQILEGAIREKENEDFVFDIYCLDVKRSRPTQDSVGGSAEVPSEMNPSGPDQRITLMEPLQLSRQERAALRGGQESGLREDDSDSEEQDLLYDEDSDDDDLFENDDEDSNDEAHAANDYPDEEDGSEGWMPGGGDDDEIWMPGHRSDEERSDQEIDSVGRMKMPSSDIWTQLDTALPRFNDGYDGASDSD